MNNMCGLTSYAEIAGAASFAVVFIINTLSILYLGRKYQKAISISMQDEGIC